MPLPLEPRRCSLHVLVPSGGIAPDPVGLANALGRRLDAVTVMAWSGRTGDVDHATAARAADVIDEVTARTALRATYAELHGDLVPALTRHLAAGRGTPVLSVSATAGRRVVRAVRRVANESKTPFALLPRSRGRMHERIAP